MYTLKRSITVPGTVDTVFEFFNRPENLERLTPDSLKFSMLTPSPVCMHNGAVFDYTIGLFGIPMRWTSVITNYDPPHQFVDIQLKGPYAFWHHRHSFESKGDEVEVTDEIHYEIGMWFIGNWLIKPFIQRQLNTIFSYRSHAIEALFQHPDVRQPEP
ncbi:MAG: SRPBCC family protein [Phycisphaeraceae bacterium]|nr:SRPBCC family protein [Phycisphaeraceae bacterium]